MKTPTKAEKRKASVALGIALLWSLGPLYWVISIAFRTDESVFGGTGTKTSLIPRLTELTFQSFIDVFDRYPFGQYFMNSIIISLGAVLLAMIVTIPGAYAFTRLSFPAKKFLFYYVILSLFFPWIVLVIPLYNIYTSVGLMNTYIGVIIAYTVVIAPLCLWLLRGFFAQAIDKDIEGAALIDGCSLIGAFFRVILPLAMPAVVATATFTFLVAWNEFIWVFILTSGEAKRTAVVGIHYLMGADVARDHNALLAAVLMTSLPPVIFYSFLQGFLTKAFSSAGGTKY